MSESLMIEGVITAEAGKPARAAVCPQTTAVWTLPGLNLPLAGAVLLHLGLLALALLAPRLGGRQEPMPEVYPIRLYSAAEVAGSAPTRRLDPVALPSRSSAAVVPAPAEQVAAVPLPITPAPEMVTSVAGPVPLSAAPVLPGGSGGSAAASGTGSSLTAGEVENVAAATKVMVESAAVPVALPEVLAHPLYRENREPEYPALARRRQQEGTVILEVLVTSEGTVGSLTVHQSSGHSLLDEAALKGVKGWRFEPGRRGATAVAMQVLVPVRFGLR